MFTGAYPDPDPGRRGAANVPSLSDLVGSLGSHHFGGDIARYLHQLCGADHFVLFRMEEQKLQRVCLGSTDPRLPLDEVVERYVGEQWWRRDPLMSSVQGLDLQLAPRVLHGNLFAREYGDIRRAIYPQVRDRMVVAARDAHAIFGISIIRMDAAGAFAPSEHQQMAQGAGLLMALLMKHAQMQPIRINVARAVSSLEEIEGCLHAMAQLSPRQREVCARILFGLTSTGIALDIGVGEESIKTYRKRAYEQLGIGSERELLTWYLTQWSTWRGLYSQGLTH